MIYWTHELVNCDDGLIRVCEVFWDHGGKPWSYSPAEAFSEPEGNSDHPDPAASIRMQLEHMLMATHKPILIYPEDFTGETPNA